MFYRGISGGQKQRVSVGEQLVANPSILFLDEPTSGLDSAASFQLMLNLREICRKTNISIISSIHQPSQRVFDMSDRLMILAGGKNFGGNTAYFGRTEHLEDHFNEIGIVKTSKSSVAEWVIDEVNGDFGQPESIQSIISGYSKSKSYLEMQDEHSFVKENQEISLQKQKDISVFKFTGDYQKSSFCFDLVRLFKRNFLNILKNPLIFIARLISYSIMSLILGTVWWGSGDEPKAGDVSDINGVLFFASTFFTIMAISLLPNMIEDRQIMVKEKSNGCYNLMNFIISNFVTSLPVTFIITLVSSSIIFFMIGFDADNGAAFIKFVINLYLMQLAGEGLILIIAFIFDQLLICIVTVSMIMGSFMIMEGFFIRYDSIPDGWIWLYWINFCTYGMKNFMMIIYDGLTIQADPSAIPPVLYDYPGEQILESYKMNDIDYGVNILILIGWLLLFRTIGGIYSYYKHTGKK
ncbi:P-loop containing nucleoside triphosphate hydrolase [Pseudocohnilembus persalinus]|uniref:p-loop containing nucleoside triphosphate hydrolase n=1 Tax=Pseudocohnilembus persalinus TaxID=266149 RepID=A0A0V0Q8F3_PSEPJ|nr:P-loop containing nucleoside triphosphate hydrolase [Pseudocohnilembus persalinus]|eukprot:KRW98536.1 P-loop containing nucleoside triphosphate hydrolase [Pseudocohnilembus persalinus]